MEKVKVVPDTGFILQAALNAKGPAGRALSLLENDAYTIILSPQVRGEIEDVLHRPSLRARFPHLSNELSEAMMGRLDHQAQFVTVLRPYIEFPRDPNDEPVLNLAIQEQVDYIIARDNDLLNLGQGTDFRLLYPYLRIVNPVQFLALAVLPSEPPPAS